jgi:hypothetical protein
MLNKIKQKSKTTAMSKTRRKSHGEGEHFKGIIRELTKENRQLKKELKHLKKGENLYENNKEEIQEILEKKNEPDATKQKLCTDCFKGYFEEIEILGKVFGTCGTCGFRKKLK